MTNPIIPGIDDARARRAALARALILASITLWQRINTDDR